MRLGLGLGLVTLLGCGPPSSLTIDAAFKDVEYGTMLLNISDVQERWFVLTADGQGREDLPALRLEEGGSFSLTAHLYALAPMEVGFQVLGELPPPTAADPKAERVLQADRVFRLAASYTSSGSWAPIEVPETQSYPLSPKFVEPECPPFKAQPIHLSSATEPVAARARRGDGHFVLLTGRYGGAGPSDLRAYDLDPITRTSVEIDSPTIRGLRARQYQVGAAIEGDDGKLWLTLNGPAGPSGAPPRTVLWTGTLEGGGTITATLSDPQWIRWMAWTDPDPRTAQRDLLLLSDYGQLRQFHPASRTARRLIPSGGLGGCYGAASSNPNYNLTVFCGGIARDGARGFVVSTPDRRFFRLSGLGAVTATLTVAIQPGVSLLPAAVSPEGKVWTMSVDQTSAFTHLFELAGAEFEELGTDITDQAPTVIFPYGENILYGGMFGYLTKYIPKKLLRCPSDAGLLGGLVPTAADPIGPDSWLLTGGSPVSPKTVAVILSR